MKTNETAAKQKAPTHCPECGEALEWSRVWCSQDPADDELWLLCPACLVCYGTRKPEEETV